MLEALSNARNTSGLRKLLVVLAACDSTLAPLQEGGLPSKSFSPKSQVNELPAKRRKDFPPIDPEELPPGFSTNSHFVRLGEIATVSKGKTGIKDALPGHYPLVVTAEGRSSCDHFDFEGPAVIIPTVSSTGHGDASLKRIHFQEGKYAVGSILAAVHSLDENKVSARFLFEYLSAFKDELLVSRMSGTANVSLTATKIEDVPVPLVSKAGQERIAKVVRLCDALEAKGQLEAAQHAQLVQTLLGALTASTTPDELTDNWQRVATHFDLLLDRPEAVDALEQTILQLAVRGLLVPQDPSDEPASVLLQKIRIEKDRLGAEGKIKRDKPLPTVDEFPFNLPREWVWTRLGIVGESFTYGSSQKATEDASAVPILRMGNVQGGMVTMGNLKYLNDLQDELPSLLLEKGDLLFNRTNSYELVGKTGIFSGYNRPVTFASYLIRIRLMQQFCSPAYANLYMNTSDCRSNEIAPDLTQQTGQANYNGTKLKNIRFPLPPREEQSRIVARVESLRRLCTDLRQRLAARRTTQAHLAEALVSSVSH
jgi:type I restriction enzyme S subunit